MKRILTSLILCGVLLACTPADPNKALTDKAAAEYLTPVHPGGGESPFWNGLHCNSREFRELEL